jgi:hypothetical protein
MAAQLSDVLSFLEELERFSKANSEPNVTVHITKHPTYCLTSFYPPETDAPSTEYQS